MMAHCEAVASRIDEGFGRRECGGERRVVGKVVGYNAPSLEPPAEAAVARKRKGRSEKGEGRDSGS